MSDSPRIYVASLSDYNAGRLHGAWIDADQDAEDIRAEVAEMLKKSPEPIAEEWAIHDYEGFGPWKLSEYESFEHVAIAAEGIAEHGLAFAAWLDNNSSRLDSATDYADLEEDFRESYAGTFESEREYAEYLIDELGLPGIGHVTIRTGPYGQEETTNLLDELAPYLDWDALTQWATEDGWTYQEDYATYHFFRSY